MAMELRGPAPPTTRRTIACEIQERLDNVAMRAEDLARRAEEKLDCIAIPPCPDTEPDNTVRPEYPPYFESLRNRMDALSRTLDRFESIIERVEL